MQIISNSINYVIISDTASFPWGMAASTRVKNISKALINQGANVVYLGLHGANTKYKKGKQRNGSVDGIKYYYPGGFPVRSNSWFLRRIDNLIGKWLSLIKIKALHKGGSIQAVIIYSRSFNTVMFWSKILKKLNIKVVLELCEWPLTKSTGKDKTKAWKFCNEAILEVDAVLPISTYINEEINYITSKKGKSIPTFIIPILTDFVNYSLSNSLVKTEEVYILYAGSAEYMDITFLIIDVMDELKSLDCEIKLKFTGNIKTQLFNRIKAYIDYKKVAELIEFTGYLEEIQLQESMINAVCLLAPLPDTEQSKARFPTKIGYYLSSGRPVVLNSVGSAMEYFSAGVNIFIADKFEARSIALKVMEIINDPMRADKIGQAGKQFAFEKFYYLNACAGLNDFLKRI